MNCQSMKIGCVWKTPFRKSSHILCVKHAGMISVSKDLRDSKSMDQSNKSLSVMCETCMSKRSRHQYIQW